MGLSKKFGRIRLRGFGVTGLKVGGAFSTNFQRLLSAKLHYTSYANTLWRCNNGTDVLYHHAKFGETRRYGTTKLDVLARAASMRRGLLCSACINFFLGRLLRVRPPVRPSVRPSTKSLFNFNEIWYIGRDR